MPAAPPATATKECRRQLLIFLSYIFLSAESRQKNVRQKNGREENICASFASQSDHRIHFRDAARRNQACQQRHQRQQQRNADVSSLFFCLTFSCRRKADRKMEDRKISAPHSHLKATIGSTFAARRAGIRHASSATSASNKGMPTKVSGSVSLTLNSRVFINRVNAMDPATPTATPPSANIIPLLTTSRSTSIPRAPRAIRTPISCVRCATE